LTNSEIIWYNKGVGVKNSSLKSKKGEHGIANLFIKKELVDKLAIL
jgi:hypothetical protein